MSVKKVDIDAASTLQLAMFRAILAQIEEDPLKVSASTLAVAERLLARYNVGLGFNLDEDKPPSKEELEALEEWEKMKVDSDLFINE